MFEHSGFEKYAFEDIPLNRDIYVMDERYMSSYEEMNLNVFDGEEHRNIGYVGYFAARKVNANSVEMSWYPNIHTRFHEVTVSLPRSEFVACVMTWNYDRNPHIFVKNEWLETLYLRSYSLFGLVDAIGVKTALESGSISKIKLLALRSRIDLLSKDHPEVSFISFADNLLIKSNWSVGHFQSETNYTYEPETFIHLLGQLNTIYVDVLDLETYAVLTQGHNEYYDEPRLHISNSGNHVSLNSLGIPFAQLLSIEAEARRAIKKNIHKPAELYMDELYYHSLNYRHGFDKHDVPSNAYHAKMMSTPSKYYYSSREQIISNLEDPKHEH